MGGGLLPFLLTLNLPLADFSRVSPFSANNAGLTGSLSNPQIDVNQFHTSRWKFDPNQLCLILNSHVSLPHRRDTKSSLETNFSFV